MNEFLNLFSLGYVFRSYSIALAGLEHMMLLPQPPKSWHHKCALSHSASWASLWAKLSTMKLLFAWLSMVYLEPAGPVPAQTLACHSGSRESISSCDLKIPKEVAPASQSGYQVSFSINSVHLMRFEQLLRGMEARERCLPTGSASPASSAFSKKFACTQSSSPLPWLCEEHICKRWPCPWPPRSWRWRSDSEFLPPLFCKGTRNSLPPIWPPMEFCLILPNLHAI